MKEAHPMHLSVSVVVYSNMGSSDGGMLSLPIRFNLGDRDGVVSYFPHQFQVKKKNKNVMKFERKSQK